MSPRHSTDRVAPDVAELTSQIVDTHEQLADTVGELAAAMDVGARVRAASEQAKANVGRAADRVGRRIGSTGDRMVRAVVGRRPETSTRELVLQTARFSGPVLAGLGGVMLGAAAVLAVARRR
ncbi:DUF3618 domain-containing protein [Kitasatospora terrestris]|uniref:DUF3618 domain-containing protein n=1 Tax=Kitasatospora terrestris TaxID=258051 RepID=A0ABP9DGN8_9ACTN